MLSPLHPIPADWSNPEFSPDGDRLAIDIRRDDHKDIWVHELATGAMVRVTDDLTNEEHPVWTRDGKHIVYRSFASSKKPAGHTLSIARADGMGDAEVLIESNRALIPGSSHPAQNLLAYAAETSTTDADIVLLPIEGDETGGWKVGQPTPFVNTPAREWSPMFSPDGRWLAYGSEEAGRISPPSGDVYVVPFPGGAEKVTVSTAGGERPTWSRLRNELVFTTLARDYRRILMVAPYRVVNDSFRPDKPRPWSATAVLLRILAGQKDYALHPDGMRVAIADIGEDEGLGQTHLTFVFNFLEESRRVAPPQP
jgi:Tol biopolymer transport system component